jgi:hypothetical protein
MEGALLVRIITKYIAGIWEKALFVLLFALYIGHIDRSGVSDMFCGLAGLWLMWVTYRRLLTGESWHSWTIMAMAVVMPSMTLVKYNAIAIVALPMVLFVFLGVLRRKWILDIREWGGASPLYLSLGSVVDLVSKVHRFSTWSDGRNVRCDQV